jgi:hypothetical protein
MSMENSQIENALAAADALLLDYPPERFPYTGRPLPFLGKQAAGSHLRWMIAEARTMLADGRREKVMRWLGFIQGTLWAMGVSSIDSLKDANRPVETVS